MEGQFSVLQSCHSNAGKLRSVSGTLGIDLRAFSSLTASPLSYSKCSCQEYGCNQQTQLAQNKKSVICLLHHILVNRSNERWTQLVCYFAYKWGFLLSAKVIFILFNQEAYNILLFLNGNSINSDDNNNYFILLHFL